MTEWQIFTTGRRVVVAVAAVAAMVALAACGSGTSGAAGSGGSNNSPGVPAAKSAVAKLESATGTFSAPDVTGEKPALPGKNIYIISCGETSSSCARATTGAKDAISAAGWSSKVFDTKGDYSTATQGIRQAIAAKADGIFIYFIDCSYMKSALEEAKAAGIPVVQAEGADCNEVDKSAKPLFTWSVTYKSGSLLDWVKTFSEAQTSYLIAATKGKADTIMFADNAAVLTKVQLAAFQDQMKPCTGCKYKIVKFSFTQMASGLSQQVGDALTANPNANSVVVAYDALLQAGVSQAVEQARRSGRKIMVIAGEGQTPTMALIRNGQVAAGSGLDNEWEAWSAMDSLNRIFNGQKPVTSGIGNQIFDKTHNLPKSGPYVSPIDFRATYTKAWTGN